MNGKQESGQEGNEEHTSLFLDDGLPRGSSLASWVPRRRESLCCHCTQVFLLLILIGMAAEILSNQHFSGVLSRKQDHDAVGFSSGGSGSAPASIDRCWMQTVDLRNDSVWTIEASASSGRWLSHVVSAVKDNGLASTQGLAYRKEGTADGSFTIFESHTKGVRSYRINPKARKLTELRTVRYDYTADNFPQIVTPTNHTDYIAHIGGIAYSSDKDLIWMATHNDLKPHDQPVANQPYKEVGALLAIDPATLQPSGHMLFERDDHAFDWVIINNDRHIGYASQFFNITIVKRFDTRTLEPMEDLVLQLPPLPTFQYGVQYIQSGTLAPDGSLYLISDDYHQTLLRFDPDSGKLLSSQRLLAGEECDGMVYIPMMDVLMVGFNHKGHDKVKYESTYIFEPVTLEHGNQARDGSYGCGGKLRLFEY